MLHGDAVRVPLCRVVCTVISSRVVRSPAERACSEVAKKHTHDKQRLPRSCNAAEDQLLYVTKHKGARVAQKF